jgi:23S rRNA pseudouridine1911/1915/1917 synthase
LNVRLETGRTHQIRVHLLAINHPIAGDSHYGGIDGELGLRRQFLHASRLEFSHPSTGDRVAFESDLPADLRDALQSAGA